MSNLSVKTSPSFGGGATTTSNHVPLPSTSVPMSAVRAKSPFATLTLRFGLVTDFKYTLEPLCVDMHSEKRTSFRSLSG